MGDALGLLLLMVIAGIALVVFVPWFFYRKGRKAERKEVQHEQALDAQRRVKAGRDRARDHGGLTPDERLRANDGEW